MRILVDRFIYQGLRHIPRRHAVPDQDLCPEIPRADEKRSLNQVLNRRNCRLVDDCGATMLFVATIGILQASATLWSFCDLLSNERSEDPIAVREGRELYSNVIRPGKRNKRAKPLRN